MATLTTYTTKEDHFKVMMLFPGLQHKEFLAIASMKYRAKDAAFFLCLEEAKGRLLLTTHEATMGNELEVADSDNFDDCRYEHFDWEFL